MASERRTCDIDVAARSTPPSIRSGRHQQAAGAADADKSPRALRSDFPGHEPPGAQVGMASQMPNTDPARSVTNAPAVGRRGLKSSGTGGPGTTPPDECETCGNPDGVLCDECALEEHLGDIERAERLREEDVFLYSIPLRTGKIV